MTFDAIPYFHAELGLRAWWIGPDEGDLEGALL
jgi:hypothetical protein